MKNIVFSVHANKVKKEIRHTRTKTLQPILLYL